MDFRNRKNAATNNAANKSTSKTNKTFVKLSEVKGAVQIDNGAIWLKSGKYDAPSVSIKVDPEVTLFDWVRKITLRDVEVSVEENEKGYPELIISGQGESGDSGDLPF